MITNRICLSIAARWRAQTQGCKTTPQNTATARADAHGVWAPKRRTRSSACGGSYQHLQIPLLDLRRCAAVPLSHANRRAHDLGAGGALSVRLLPCKQRPARVGIFYSLFFCKSRPPALRLFLITPGPP